MARAYVYDMVDTWNAGATTFTAVKMNVTDTASAAGSLLMDLQVGGSSKFKVAKDGRITTTDGIILSNFWLFTNNLNLGSTCSLRWASTTDPFGTIDTILARDAANTLAQRNGTNAQAFRVYNTYTDASNYERLAVVWSSNDVFIRSEGAGTGAARPLFIGTEGATNLNFRTSATARWAVASNGHFIAATDDTYDIGASGANRPRNLFVGGYLSIGDGITAPGAGTGQARIYVDTADGDLKIIFADGTVKTIVTDT